MKRIPLNKHTYRNAVTDALVLTRPCNKRSDGKQTISAVICVVTAHWLHAENGIITAGISVLVDVHQKAVERRERVRDFSPNYTHVRPDLPHRTLVASSLNSIDDFASISRIPAAFQTIH
jgi:hypothetical protein